MADIFERLLKNYGPLGQHRERAHGYFAFPKLEGEISNRMKFRNQEMIGRVFLNVHQVFFLQVFFQCLGHHFGRIKDAKVG